MDLSPIIVFCYNRPWHVEQTLEALSKNIYADESILYIFCDGPKDGASEAQIKKIEDTRTIVRKKTWCKEVHVFEAEKNKGLANSIIDGVSKVIEKYGKVIVLEDDLVSSPYFLKYMNEALLYYSNRMGVMSIAANRPPKEQLIIPKDYQYDVFVTLGGYSTGWGTWKDRWSSINWSLDFLDELLKHPYEVDALSRMGDSMIDMLMMQRKGSIDSWAVRFSFWHFHEHRIGIMPCVSYVDNIGFDGTGIHSGSMKKDNIFRNDLTNAIRDCKFIDILYEDKRLINQMYNRDCKVKRPLWQRIINTIFRKLSYNPPFYIKKRIYN